MNAQIGSAPAEREVVEALAKVAAHKLAADVSVSLKHDIAERGHMPDTTQIGSRIENFVCDVTVAYSPGSTEALGVLRASLSSDPIFTMSGSLCAGIESALPGFTVLGLSPGRRGMTAIVRDNAHARAMSQLTGEPITVLEPRQESRLEKLLKPFVT